MAIDLYGSKFSVPSRAVHMTARHLDIDVNFIHIDLTVKQQMEPFFIKLNPNHTIPTINDNGFVLLESRAIMQYLCNRYAPDSTLYPKEPKQRALVDRFLNFDFGFSLSQKQVLGSKLFKGVDASDDKVKAYENNLKIVDQLIGDNKYVTGNKLTIGDLSLLASGVFIEWSQYDTTLYPNYQRWYSSLKTQLSYFHDINGVSKDELDQFISKFKSRPTQTTK